MSVSARRSTGSTGGAEGRRPDRADRDAVLLGMVVLVALSNDARDEALTAERHAYDVTLLTRNAQTPASPAPKPRSAASCSTRTSRTSGNIYYSQWRLAGQQIDQLDRLVRTDPAQRTPASTSCSSCTASAARNSRLPRAPRSPSRARAAPAISTRPADWQHRQAISDAKLDEIAASRAASCCERRIARASIISRPRPTG